MTSPVPLDPLHRRAQGCLVGQLAGVALESWVEFTGPEGIRGRYPDGGRDLADGGTWDTLAGPPTDDSEMPWHWLGHWSGRGPTNPPLRSSPSTSLPSFGSDPEFSAWTCFR